MFGHVPVMLGEILQNLIIKPNGVYVDLTIGRAGHAREILKRVPRGFLYGFDKDSAAISFSEQALSKVNGNFKLFNDDFGNFAWKMKKLNISGVDGILADLGVSSPQVDDVTRGFSYGKNAGLDMRMNQNQKLSAKEVVNKYSEEKLRTILREYGDLKNAGTIAKNICKQRPVWTTTELANIVKASCSNKMLRQKNPLKPVFQAIRIEVNDEVNNLKKMLKTAPLFLKKKAFLAVITFHSLEDKIVKNAFKDFLPPENNKLPQETQSSWKAKQYRVSQTEKEANFRARSAKLRVLWREL